MKLIAGPVLFRLPFLTPRLIWMKFHAAAFRQPLGVDVHQQVEWFIGFNDGSGTSVLKQVPGTSWSQTLTDERMHPVGWVDGAEAVPSFGFPLISYPLISAMFGGSPYADKL
jgi:hypothetical protein